MPIGLTLDRLKAIQQTVAFSSDDLSTKLVNLNRSLLQNDNRRPVADLFTAKNPPRKTIRPTKGHQMQVEPNNKDQSEFSVYRKRLLTCSFNLTYTQTNWPAFPVNQAQNDSLTRVHFQSASKCKASAKVEACQANQLIELF